MGQFLPHSEHLLFIGSSFVDCASWFRAFRKPKPVLIVPGAHYVGKHRTGTISNEIDSHMLRLYFDSLEHYLGPYSHHVKRWSEVIWDALKLTISLSRLLACPNNPVRSTTFKSSIAKPPCYRADVQGLSSAVQYSPESIKLLRLMAG